jgi:hypothetical protein
VIRGDYRFRQNPTNHAMAYAGGQWVTPYDPPTAVVANINSPPLDDILLERCQRGHELLLLARRDLELVEASPKVLHQGIEVPIGDSHTAMGALHVAAGVGARAAAGLTDLLDQQKFQPRNVGFGEELVDAAVARDIADEVIDHGRDGRQAAKPLVQGFLRRAGHVGVGRTGAQHGRNGRRKHDSHGISLHPLVNADELATPPPLVRNLHDEARNMVRGGRIRVSRSRGNVVSYAT